ncbi:hypothetical protein M3Y99_00476800 [Aphelenchoides fujianensis]|nr:hypothetical protein M3Y99_00476800 [Aphelenchoides fujianensis]
MMKATCVWTERNTTSFRWTRDELIAPPSAHRELSRSQATGNGEVRCSPLFPLHSVAGVLAHVSTSTKFKNAEPTTFVLHVGPKGELKWEKFEVALWIEAANGASYVAAEMNGRGDQQELHAGTKTPTVPLMRSAASSFTNLSILDRE